MFCPEVWVDLLDDSLGSHGLQDLLQSLVAVVGGVGVDLVGVDDAAVAQGDAGLLGQELGIVLGDDDGSEQLVVVLGNGLDDQLSVLGGSL